MKLENLQKVRLEHDMSQEKLGEEIGYLSQQTIHKYECGISDPSISTLISFADYFNVSVDYILGLTDERHKVEKVTEYELNNEELVHINAYRKLNKEDKWIIDLMTLRLIKSKF